MSDLTAKGIVWEVDYGQASPARRTKPIHLKLNDDVFGMIGLDLRREKVSGCLVHLGGDMEAEVSYPIPEKPSREAVLDMLGHVIERLLAIATVPVMGIGLGTIGHVEQTRASSGPVTSSPYLRSR